MQDIANAAGVGKATVSLALRDDPRLREETRRRIQKIASDMGYQTNAVVANLMAQLRASKTPKFQATVGLVNVSGDKGIFREVHTFQEWVSGCNKRAEQIGYGIDEFWLHEPGINPARLLKILESRNIRGLILAAVLEHGILPEEYREIWNRFACVVVGIQAVRPAMHFACNDQYSTSFNAVRQVERFGYSKPALVIDAQIDSLLDYRFSAGFWGASHLFPQNRRIPIFNYSDKAQISFAAWFQKHKPDVIITFHERIIEWLSAMNIKVPGEVGLVHLDHQPSLTEWAGMKQNNHLVGMAAVDMLVGQLHRSEFGTPTFTKCTLIESSFIEGKTILRKIGKE